jgi:DNA-binding NtrC family response regulator
MRRGHFEKADGGTIFLDEISTMDERTQVSLLRVLETKTFRQNLMVKKLHPRDRHVARTW